MFAYEITFSVSMKFMNFEEDPVLGLLQDIFMVCSTIHFIHIYIYTHKYICVYIYYVLKLCNPYTYIYGFVIHIYVCTHIYFTFVFCYSKLIFS